MKVSRSEIEARLWPNTRPPKNRLNVVVSEARSALGDTNKEPRKYIATLGEDGYCFIHPIKRVDRATGSYDDIEAEQAYREGMQCLENREDSIATKCGYLFQARHQQESISRTGMGRSCRCLHHHGHIIASMPRTTHIQKLSLPQKKPRELTRLCRKHLCRSRW